MEEPDWPTPRRGLTRSVDDAEDFSSVPGTVFRDHSLNTPLVEDDHQVRGLTRSVDDAEDFASVPGIVFRDHSLNTPYR